MTVLYCENKGEIVFVIFTLREQWIKYSIFYRKISTIIYQLV